MTTWNLFEAILGSVVGGEESEVLGDKYERARNDTFAVAKHEVAFRRHFDGFMAKGMSIGVWKHSREGGVVPSLKTSALWKGPDGAYHVLYEEKFSGITGTSYDEVDVLTFAPSEVVAVHPGCISATFLEAKRVVTQKFSDSHCFSLLLDNGSTVDFTLLAAQGVPSPSKVQRALVSGFSSLAYENGRKLKVAEKGMLKGYKRAPPMVSLPEQASKSDAHLGSHAGAFMASPRYGMLGGNRSFSFSSSKQPAKGTQISNPAYSSETNLHPKVKAKPSTPSYAGFDVPFRGVKPTVGADAAMLPAPKIVMEEAAHMEHAKDSLRIHEAAAALEKDIIRWNRVAREAELTLFGSIESEQDYNPIFPEEEVPPTPPAKEKPKDRALVVGAPTPVVRQTEFEETKSNDPPQSSKPVVKTKPKRKPSPAVNKVETTAVKPPAPHVDVPPPRSAGAEVHTIDTKAEEDKLLKEIEERGSKEIGASKVSKPKRKKVVKKKPTEATSGGGGGDSAKPAAPLKIKRNKPLQPTEATSGGDGGNSGPSAVPKKTGPPKKKKKPLKKRPPSAEAAA